MFMSTHRVITTLFVLFILGSSTIVAQQREPADGDSKPVFSGPQVGEKLPPLKAQGVFDDQKGKMVDLLAEADGKPLLVVFVHQFTRPTAGLSRVLMSFSTLRKGKVYGALVFLTDDVTAMEARLARARRAFGGDRPIMISPDGPEGPGAYGLNRKVAMTVIFADKGKVLGNHAIIDPSVQADTNKILAGVVKTIGGEVPTLAQLGAVQYTGQNTDQPFNLRPLLAPVINKQATPEQVEAAAKRAEAVFARNEAARIRIGQVSRRIIAGGVLERYGTPKAQEYLKKWATAYPEPKDRPQPKDQPRENKPPQRPESK